MPTLKAFSLDTDLEKLNLFRLGVSICNEYRSWSQSVQIPALEAGMILAGIRLCSALQNLWVLTEPRVESFFVLENIFFSKHFC